MNVKTATLQVVNSDVDEGILCRRATHNKTNHVMKTTLATLSMILLGIGTVGAKESDMYRK